MRQFLVYSAAIIIIIIGMLNIQFDEPMPDKPPFGYLYSVGGKGHIYSGCRYIRNKQVKLVVSDSVEVCLVCIDKLYEIEVESQR